MVLNVVRIAKVVALLAFVLPWMAVSCQGVDLATASGIDLIQGKMTANPQASEQMGGLGGGMGDVSVSDNPASQSPDLGMNYFAAGAAAVIVLGLLLTFIGGAKTAGRNALISSLVAAGLAFGATWQFKEQIRAESAADQQASAADNPFGGAGNPFGAGGNPFGGGDMIDSMVQYRIGFWGVLGALLVAAGAGGVAMSSGGAASVRPDSM